MPYAIPEVTTVTAAATATTMVIAAVTSGSPRTRRARRRRPRILDAVGVQIQSRTPTVNVPTEASSNTMRKSARRKNSTIVPAFGITRATRHADAVRMRIVHASGPSLASPFVRNARRRCS